MDLNPNTVFDYKQAYPYSSTPEASAKSAEFAALIGTEAFDVQKLGPNLEGDAYWKAFSQEVFDERLNHNEDD